MGELLRRDWWPIATHDMATRVPVKRRLLGEEGRCLEQSGEPADSTFKDRIRATAYPARELGGLDLMGTVVVGTLVGTEPRGMEGGGAAGAGKGQR